MGLLSREPASVERVGQTALKVVWTDGHESLYAWDYLRAACPCAVCREGEPPRYDPQLKPADIQPVGRYALTVRWSDGHATGIYSYEYLRSLCGCEACKPSQLDEG